MNIGCQYIVCLLLETHRGINRWKANVYSNQHQRKIGTKNQTCSVKYIMKEVLFVYSH